MLFVGRLALWLCEGVEVKGKLIKKGDSRELERFFFAEELEKKPPKRKVEEALPDSDAEMDEAHAKALKWFCRRALQ